MSEQLPPADDPAENDPNPDPPTVGRRRRVQEIWLVLGLSLGQSAVYSVISLVAKLTAGKPLAQQTATLNASASPRPYLDLTYQLADVAFTLVPAGLALWLLTTTTLSGVRRVGLDLHRPGRDLGVGALLALVIGLPGLALYVVGHRLGITATVVAAALNTYWWTVPVLVLQALKNGLIEEVVVVGYLMTRLRELRWPTWAVLGCSAVLRGSYHLYQGFGPFFGNAVMGLVFGEYFRRRGRVMPLVVAHTLLDVVSFVGYQLFADALHLR
jgi:membrane protease YdiL (CAAX protease family)